MATLLDALSQENLDNQREVVKNEKRQSYDNRPYGSFYEKLMAAVFPAGHPYHHTPIGSMEDLDAAEPGRRRVAFFRTWYAPNNAVLTIAGDVDEEPVIADGGALLRPHRANPDLPAYRCPRSAGSVSTFARDRAGRGAARARPRGLPQSRLRHARVRRPGGRHARSSPAGEAAGCTSGWCARSRIAQDVAVFALPLVAGSSIVAGWVTVRPDADVDAAEAILDEELRR